MTLKQPRRRWIKNLIILIILGLIFTFWAVKTYETSQPQSTGHFLLKGLSGKVSIIRDETGIVHIIADKSEKDAWFALGYVHAQDRLWQMEFNRRLASGTLSEVFGSKTLPIDKYFRTWGLYQAAHNSWSSLSPKAQSFLQSYTDGINAYISQNKLPLQFTLLFIHPKPWTVIDSLSWQKVLAWDLQTIWKAKFNNFLVKNNLGMDQIPVLFPPYPKNAPTVLSDADLKQSGIYRQATLDKLKAYIPATAQDKGSNNWVISGQLTTTGKPILANDPHLEMQSPSIWYLAEIKAPGLDVIGATMPGIPGIVIGHNQKIAWGVTNVNPDTQDLYIIPEQLKNKIQTRQEKIIVRGGKDVDFNVSTFQGMPIISSITETSQISPNVALKWTAFDKSDKTTQSILKIDASKNWNEFTDALQDFDTPSQNFVFADIDGNIGYYLSGKIPIRHWESNLPVLYDQNHQWSGYIPFSELPHVFNPSKGFVATANNLVVTPHYPYQINFRWPVPAYRIERITDLIQKYKPLDIPKNILIQQDTKSLLWKSLSPRLIQTKPLDKDSEMGLKYLKYWNGDTGLNSIPSTLFAYWYQQLDLLMPDFLTKQSKYPEPLFVLQQININDPKAGEFLSKSLQAAMRKCINDLGHDPKNWEWKNIHQAKFNELGIGALPGINLLWNRSIPTSGSLYTVNAGTYNPESFFQNDGASYRQIIDLSDLNHSLFVTTLGQSNDPFNKNYDDQLPLWQKGQYLMMSTDPKDWKSQRELVLEPE